MAGVRRVAVVTGAGRGIGRAVANGLARVGIAVAVAARTREQVEAAAGAIRTGGGGAIAVVLDVTDAKSVEAAIARVEAELGAVDVLVNNAGIAESAAFTRTGPEMWERHLRVNATGPYLMTRATLPGMLERGWGRVINIASMAGLVGAKHLDRFERSLAACVLHTAIYRRG